MLRYGIMALALLTVLGGAATVSWLASSAAVEAADSSCIECHRMVTPGIVDQFTASKKYAAGLDCSTCHGTGHQTADDAANAELPSPDTCKLCHPEKYEQYVAGKHSKAWVAMEAMPMWSHQPVAVTGQGYKGCSGCHKIGLKGEGYSETTDFRYGTGACDSCHTRHSFDADEARDPRACMTCHMGFDHPHWEMWVHSKHGTIWQIEEGSGRAPTCQTCHMQGGDHAVKTSWGFLAVRLPEDDPEWMADRVVILQALGVLDWEGNSTPRLDVVKAGDLARLDAAEFNALREEMLAVCANCHSMSYAKANLDFADNMVREADQMMAEAILVVKGLYDDGVLEKPAGWDFAPDLLQFYEARSSIEQELWVMFLEHRMRTFQGAFHMNPDYAHWYGWAEMKNSLTKIKDEAAKLRGE